MFIVSVGINYKTAPVEIRERVSFSQEDLSTALERLKAKPMVEGCVILSTCNRSEIYAATTDVEKGLAQVKCFLSENCGFPVREIEDYIYVHTIYDAIRHLFKLVAGLDSMILGETQILGQVKYAYQTALDAGVTNPVLHMFFQQALTVGKRVRTATGIDRNAVSISYAAAEMAKQRLGDLNGRNVLVVGAGEMSELTVRNMMSHGATHVTVVNRSQERAVELAGKFDGRAASFSEIGSCLEWADIVISATAASRFVVSAGLVTEIMEERTDRPLFMIDIAVPRDIDPAAGAVPGVTLLDIDDLRHVVDCNLEERKQAAVKASQMIECEIEEMLRCLGSRFVVPTISAFKDKLESIKKAELDRALHRLNGLSEREIKVVETLVTHVVNQIMHDPVVNLKEYATTHQGHLYAEIFQNLFNLNVEGQREKKHNEETLGGSYETGNYHRHQRQCSGPMAD